MKLIPLPQGRFAIVDDDDFEELSQFRWSCAGKADRPYVRRVIRRQNGGSAWSLYMHRVIARPGKGMDVDHIDGNVLNNRRSNLRVCWRYQNARNRKLGKLNKSGFKGVFLIKRTGKFSAAIKVNYHSKYLGCFSTARDAAMAYNRAAMQWFGDFARLNIL